MWPHGSDFPKICHNCKIQNYQNEQGGKEAFLKTIGAQHALGHLGEPDDIGYGIVYLASDESKFVTGSELVIDGGYTAR